MRIAENGHGFFGMEEIFIFNDGPFVANGNSVDTFEIRLDADSLPFLTGTGFPSAVDLGPTPTWFLSRAASCCWSADWDCSGLLDVRG